MDIHDSYDRANQNEPTVEESDRPVPSRSQSGTASRQDSDPAAAPQDTPTPSWCRCGNRQQMPTQIENKCCRLKHCFTTEQQFHDAVLNTVVLATCMNREKDLFPHDIPRGNQSYRHYAYRQYTYLVHHYLGAGNRRVVPSCAVLRIRKQYPSAFYKGFINGVHDVHTDQGRNFESSLFQQLCLLAIVRSFIFWQGKLGVGNRRVIPSCCVTAIHRHYPSFTGVYKGFIPGRFVWKTLLKLQAHRDCIVGQHVSAF
eukprot:XP_011673717.1 PREDICTED: P2X purinoceptor 7-like [Strongylocentrotus purpuratus]